MSQKHARVLVSLMAASMMLAACGGPTLNGVSAQRGLGKVTESTTVLQAKNAFAGMPNEVIVTTESEVAPQVAGAKALDKFSFRGTTYHLLDVGSQSMMTKVLGALRTTQGVRLADPNPMVYALDAAAPDDEFYGLQFGLIQQDIPTAWQTTQGDPNMVVAVVDTGVDFTHPDLKDRVIQGNDFTFRPGRIFNRKDKNGPMDDNSHGTHCAGIIGASANNQTGIAGVAPGVKILGVKVLDAKGSGTNFDVMKGVAYSVTNGAKIVSMSLGGTSATSVERKFYEAAVQSGALIVAAAGNSADGLGFPSAYSGVLSVGATDSGGALAKFSNHDATMSVTAPGVGILSTMPGNRYAKLSGTSMACPFVAGAAALVWSMHPDWTAQQVKERIEQTATDKGAPGVDAMFGHGEINIQAALAGARK